MEILQHFLKEVECIIDKLTAVGEPITEPLRVGMILESLFDSYMRVSTALECRSEADCPLL